MKDLSIIIASFNTKNLTVQCIKSIQEKTKNLSFEIIVVDNGSTDGSVEALKKLKDITLIINKENLGFAKANNQGILKASGKYILLLNSDTHLIEDSLSQMVNFMDNNEKVGISTCQLLNSDKSIQETGGSFPNLLRVFLWSTFLDDVPGVSSIFGSFHPHTPTSIGKSSYFNKQQKQDWVKGAFMLVRKQVMDKVGGLDEKIFMYAEDVEFCYRVKKLGWEVLYTPITKIVHIGGASGITENTLLKEYEGLIYFYKKHKGSFQTLILRMLIKLGAFLRLIMFNILGRKEMSKIYAKALAAN